MNFTKKLFALVCVCLVAHVTYAAGLEPATPPKKDNSSEPQAKQSVAKEFAPTAVHRLYFESPCGSAARRNPFADDQQTQGSEHKARPSSPIFFGTPCGGYSQN